MSSRNTVREPRSTDNPKPTGLFMSSVPWLLVKITDCGQTLALCSSHHSRTACVFGTQLVMVSLSLSVNQQTVLFSSSCDKAQFRHFLSCSSAKFATGRSRHAHPHLVKVSFPRAVSILCNSVSSVPRTLLCFVRASCSLRGNVTCVWGPEPVCLPVSAFTLHLLSG